MDDRPDGRVKCTTVNWTGVVYRIPRTSLDKCNQMEDLRYGGIYILFGKDDKNDKDLAYIGQAGPRKSGEGILRRIKNHLGEEVYWNEMIAVTTNNNFLGATELSYLENHFFKDALEAQRYSIKNANEPFLGSVTEERESEIREFEEKAKLLIGVLGFKIFQPTMKDAQNARSQKLQMIEEEEKESKANEFYIKRKVTGVGELTASVFRTPDGFVIPAGTKISSEVTKAVPQSVLKIRNDPEFVKNFITLKETQFPTPSAACTFVFGKSENGRTRLINRATGLSLKEMEEQSEKQSI